MTRATRTGSLLLVAIATAAAAWSCGAPASQPLQGPAAEDIQASLDSGTASFVHGEWDRLLAGAVEGRLLDYASVRRDRQLLDRYLERVAAVDLAELAPEHLEALLINAYNAYTVRAILEHPDVETIRDIDGVWTETTRDVGGHQLTLDEIEHNLLRPFFRDPRVHFAVNCASMSCAPLPRWAFSGDSLDVQLERRSRAFLRDTANVRVRGGTLHLSRYFEWYGSDFTGEDWSPRAETIPAFVARYARGDVADLVEEHGGDPPVAFLDYDWSLNAAGSGPQADAAGAAGSTSTSAGGPGPEAAATTGGRAVPGDAAAPTGSAGPGSVGGATLQAEPAAPAASGSNWVARLRRWVQDLGPAAPLAYGAAYVVATVLFLPGSPLTIGAGVAFGLLWGTVLVSIASVTGAALAFLVARRFLRGRVASSIRDGRELPLLGSERSARAWRFVELVDRAIGEQGWKIVGLTRLSPAFPFNVQNYAYGLTSVRFRDYVLASWIAMLPGTLLYVYLGAAGASVARAATGAADWGRTALQVVGVLATLAVVVAVGRIATRVVRREAGKDPDAETNAEANAGAARAADAAAGDTIRASDEAHGAADDAIRATDDGDAAAARATDAAVDDEDRATIDGAAPTADRGGSADEGGGHPGAGPARG